MNLKKLIGILFVAAALSCMTVSASAADNLALGKEAFASSKYSDDDTYGPQNVTNGKYSDIWSMGSVKLTGNKAGYQYVAVDLGEAYMIDSVKGITRRGLDQVGDRTGWIFQLANDREFSDAVTIGVVETPSAFEEDYVFVSELETPYRYVRIASPQYITVAELEVYGEPYDPVTMGRKKVFSDISGKSYAPAAMLSSALGIMEGVSPYEFAGESILTRAQAAKLMCAFSQTTVKTPEKQTFLDVTPEHWAYSYIHTAYEQGIISADEKFRPEDYVTDKEFLKMVMYAMGYGTYIEYNGGWDSGIYYVASELSLERNVKIAAGENINRGQAAQIIYNALLAPKSADYNEDRGYYFSKDDKTMLEREFDLIVVEGIMLENSVTGLIRPIDDASGHINVGGRHFRDTNAIAELWLGRNVGVLVEAEMDGEIVSAWEISTENEIVTVWDYDVTYRGNNMLKYEVSGGREKKLDFDDNMYLIKNNQAITDWTANDLVCPDGYIEFIDNDDDGEFEVAFCYEPTILVASYASNNQGEIDVVSVTGEVVSGENLKFIRMTKNGKTTTAGKIAKYDVVYAYKSANGKSLWIDVTTNKFMGELQKTTDKGYTIDGREFMLSESYKQNKNNCYPVEIGKTALFLTNGQGRIIWTLEPENMADTQMVGFVIKVTQADDFSDGPTIVRIFSQYELIDNYYFANKVRFDGAVVSAEEIWSDIDSSAVNFEGQFVMFTLNDDGKITVFDTEAQGTEDDSKIVKVTKDFGTNAVNIPDAGGIYTSGWLRQPLEADTMTFEIPWTGGTHGDADFERYYNVTNAQGALPRAMQLTELSETGMDRVEFYGLDKNDYPYFVAKYVKYSQAGSGVREITDHNSPGILVTDVNLKVNADGMVVYNICGYDINSGKQVEYPTVEGLGQMYLSDDIQREKRGWITTYKLIDISKVDMSEVGDYTADITSIKKGDIVRVQLENGNAIAVERVFEANNAFEGEYSATNDGNWYSAGRTYPTLPTAKFRLVYGLAQDIDESVFKMQTCEYNGVMGVQHILYNKLMSIFVCDGDEITRYSGGNLPALVEAGEEAVYYSADGPGVAVIVYK